MVQSASLGDGGALVVVEKAVDPDTRERMRREAQKIEAAIAIRDALDG